MRLGASPLTVLQKMYASILLLHANWCGGTESPCPACTLHGGSLHTIGNDGDDRSLRILEGIKAADVRDVGQGHDGFGAEFLRLARRGIDIVDGDIDAPLGWSTSSVR